MTFLAPWIIGIAAAATIPPLVALYFLKLKRDVRAVPSTLLWKRAVEDLHVNSPFQRLRANLLLLLQLLILLFAAMALGKPMLEQAENYRSTVVILIDHSASMAVEEEGGKTRLELAKEQAKLAVDNLSKDSRSMVIAFADSPSVVSSFDTNKDAIKEKIDSIEQTQSISNLSGAVRLAEAYAQNITIGTETAGMDIAPTSPAPQADVFLFSDGRIKDSDNVTLEKFEAGNISVQRVGTRSDNVGILSVSARRNYEQADFLSVSMTVRNFGPKSASFDAVLYVEGEAVDVKTVLLFGGEYVLEPAGEGVPVNGGVAGSEPPPGSVAVVVFDELQFAGGGVVEVSLKHSDALLADNRAWVYVRPPRDVRVLLVRDYEGFLDFAMMALPYEFDRLTPAEYESAPLEDLVDGERSIYDVVFFDSHSTSRLPQGNYFFWGAVPQIENVYLGNPVEDPIIFNWDDTHPVLRYVATEAIDVAGWRELEVPKDAVSIIEGKEKPILSYLTREATQYIISAFSLVETDSNGNAFATTDWPYKVDFVVFMQNAIQFLSSNVITAGEKNVSPGEPVLVSFPADADKVTVIRPNSGRDEVHLSGYQTGHYARTRLVGVYEIDPAVEGENIFTVNLFDEIESQVKPADTLSIGMQVVEASAGQIQENKPIWGWFLLGLLAILLIEWIVYNLRIFV